MQINPIEYKLKGNEFKILQILKDINEPVSYSQLSEKSNISDRSIRDIVRILEGLYVIEKELTNGINKYTVNEVKKWRV